MRSLLLALPLVGTLALGWPTAALAQVSPFNLDRQVGTPGAVPRAPSPGGGTNPAVPRLGPLPAPFDVNNDGVVPAPRSTPSDQDAFRPSTTTSPLTDALSPAPVIPIDASSTQERRNLERLIRSQPLDVREFRVLLANSADWLTPAVDRPIITDQRLQLDGEIASASFNFRMTSTEASQDATLAIGFTNSVLILPEASRLKISLNGRQVAQTAIDSPDRTKVIALPVSADLLRPGENVLRLDADMRHRIDCSVDATYELWTRIDTRLTGFAYSDGRVRLSGFHDLDGVGVGADGATQLHVLQRAPQSLLGISRMLDAVQAIAVRGGFEQPVVTVGDFNGPPTRTAGRLSVAIGTYDELRTVLPNVPAQAESGPLVRLVDSAARGPVLYVTGRTEADVDTAIDQLEFGGRSRSANPQSPTTPAWLLPDAVPIDRGGSITLRDAGVDTVDFSGRRFTTPFQVRLPSDFYAAAFGEATLYLDAAYSGEVLPGSSVSLVVNGNTTTVVALNARAGEVLEAMPIAIPLSEFRPGVNTIEIVGDLETRADRACLPGGTVPSNDRFALFNSTKLELPDFARIGQLPSLAAFATSGFPYSHDSGPVHVRVGGSALDSIGAAGTLFAKVAASRGAPLRTEVVNAVTTLRAESAVIVAPLAEISSLALEATGLDDLAPASWLAPFPADNGATEPEGLRRYDTILQRLRQQLRQENVVAAPGDPLTAAERGPGVDVVQDPRTDPQGDRDRWFDELDENRGVAGILSDIASSARRLLNIDGAFGTAPVDTVEAAARVEGASLIMAQIPAPLNDKTAWTLVSAPTAGLLAGSVASLTTPQNWDRVDGQITAFDLENDRVNHIAPRSVSYLVTVPMSFSNIRLFAANWLSLHTGVYALGLVLAAVLLGITTWRLVTTVGRHND